MTKIFKDQLVKVRIDIRNRYLAGETVADIARDLGISLRSLYYNLGKLTPQDKALHAQNAAFRRNGDKPSVGQAQAMSMSEEPRNAAKTPVHEESSTTEQPAKPASTPDVPTAQPAPARDPLADFM